MSNGTVRNALSQMELDNKAGGAELSEEMDILAQGKGSKIELKNPTEHNHSSEALHIRK